MLCAHLSHFGMRTIATRIEISYGACDSMVLQFDKESILSKQCKHAAPLEVRISVVGLCLR